MEIKIFLSSILIEKKQQVEAFFKEKYEKKIPFIYNSVDIRFSGYKISPVDTNVFPGGFGLLNSFEIENAKNVFKTYIKTYYPQFLKENNLLIIPENHTRNKHYLDNLVNLKNIFEKAGFNVRLGGLKIKQEPQVIESFSKGIIRIEKVIRAGDKLYLPANNIDKEFHPNFIVLNNDFPNEVPEIIQNLNIPVMPSSIYGWHKRTKSNHFKNYEKISKNFADIFGFDSWLISAYFDECENVNFKEKTGLEALATKADSLLNKIAKKYEEYSINKKPHIFIKSNNGTYGMGIFVVDDAKQIFSINKDERKNMSFSKEGKQITQVILQEGIETIERIDGKIAEPLMYLIGGNVVACNYRTNSEKSSTENLNSTGMGFAKLKEISSDNNSCSINSLIAKLASLSCMYETY